jgi:peptidyl-prolyl cis-trans isomerase B (cyclophilin B)
VTTDAPAARPVGLPPDPTPTPAQGKVLVTLVTNFGLIPMTLDRSQAPCAVQSFLHLTRNLFFTSRSAIGSPPTRP